MRNLFRMLIVFLSFFFFTTFAIGAPEVSQRLSDGPETSSGYEFGHRLNPDQGNVLSSLTYITTDKVYMKLFSGITVSDYIKMNDDLIKLRDHTNLRDINLIVNSPGGSAFDGLSIADMITRAQDEWGFKFHAHAAGIVASAAVPIFAVCEIREASPGTLFMVHEAALWKWPGRESKSDILAQAELMNKLQSLYIGFLVRNTSTSRAEWEKMEGKTTWFTVKEARKLGLLNR